MIPITKTFFTPVEKYYQQVQRIWDNFTPVSVDIHSNYLTIDETEIEAAITSKITAILATHVFGNPCNIEEIERIAIKYNLREIFNR